MKVRFTARGVRVRLDDLELSRLERGETLTLGLDWPGGGWQVALDPARVGVAGESGRLEIGLLGLLPALSDPQQEGVTLPGPPQVVVEKDFGPQHG